MILGSGAPHLHRGLGVHMLSRQFRTLVVSLALILFLCPFVHGQTTYGSVTGLVSDPSGAAVVGAAVTLTNVGTSHKTTQPSGADGRFQFVNLVPGSYQIDVEKQGFKHFTRTDVLVQVNQSTTVDASMPVGQVSETVEVTGSDTIASDRHFLAGHGGRGTQRY